MKNQILELMNGKPTTKNKIFYIVFAIALIFLVGSKIHTKFSASDEKVLISQGKSNLIRVMEYNVENLFDTINNPRTNDDELTPKGTMRWNSKRYYKKLNGIADVILSMDLTPSIIALTEIENNSVIQDLISDTELSESDYDFVTSNSADYRGVNLALIFKKDMFKPIANKSHRPNIGTESLAIYTRDILHIPGIINNGDTLDFFICHFPSRGGGEKKTEPNRIAAAELLKKATDELVKNRPNAKIIILGDFNDSPLNHSISKTLGAGNMLAESEHGSLHNLFLEKATKEKSKKSKGSYKYQSDWDYLDQFIVNGNFLDKNSSVKIKDNEAHVYRADFLLEKDRRNSGEIPYRTYVGRNNYIGGYSDHLPIYMDLIIR